MTLEAAFDQLCSALEQARDALAGLRLTVVEDKPAGADVALIDLLDDRIESVRGRLQEALIEALDGRQAARRFDYDGARRALTGCRPVAARAAREFAADIASYEAIVEVRRLGQRRGGEWRGWSAGVKQGIDACTPPLFDTIERLFDCWQELTHAAGWPVTMSAASSGGRPSGGTVAITYPVQPRS